MGIFDKFFSDKIDEPIFVKEYDSESNVQLNQLNSLLEKVGDDQKSVIEEEIKKIKIGLVGEKNVSYELKNSFLPIVCLHDIRLEYKEFSSQFDFIVISKKCIFVLETKLLTGDIIVDNNGNFIRVFKDFKGNVYKKEGINSPISQNEKHVEVLKRFLKADKKYRNIPFSSVVIIANPKTIINFNYTKKETRDLIIKHDQIKNKIIEVTKLYNNSPYSLNDKEMISLADFLVENDKHIEYDYVKRFNLKLAASIEPEKNETIVEEKVIDDSLYEGLKSLRYKLSKSKGVPLWYIFSNQQLESLVLNRPKNKAEFISLSGFGEKKFMEFGEEVINIISNSQADINGENIQSTIPSTQDKVNITQETGLSQQESIPSEQAEDNIIDSPLYKALRKFRFDQSQVEKIKPYMIYNNQELESLCKNKPQNEEEFIAIKGFGKIKFEKYGDKIINIIKANDN